MCCHVVCAPCVCACRRQGSLRYVDLQGVVQTDLMDAFNVYHTKQHVGLLRFVTLLILIVNVVLVSYDHSRFDAARFQVALILRMVVVVPLCIGIILYTYSSWLALSPDLLAIPALLLGAVIIAYGIIGEDPGYGTLAVLFVYLYW